MSSSTRSVRTICRCCAAHCSILADVEDGRVSRIRGDASNSRSEGYICPKGASLAYFHDNPDNLLHPELNGSPSPWGACLDDLAARLGKLIDTYGPGSIAFYHGTGAYYDTLGSMILRRFMAAIGSRQIYSAATVDVAPAHRTTEMICGTYETAPMWWPEDPHNRFILYLGSNPLVSHGYGTVLTNPVKRIRAFQARGGRMWVVDPRATRLTELAGRHLSIRPGADAYLLGWLARSIMEKGADVADFERMTTAPERDRLKAALTGFTDEIATQETGLPLDRLEALLAEMREAGRVAIVAGSGVTFGKHALVAEWLRWVILILTGSLDREGGMLFNPGWLNPLEKRETWIPAPPEGRLTPGPASRPELPGVLAQMPCVAMADEIEAGTIKALIVAGGSPLSAFPNPHRLETAFRSLDTLAVLDIIATPLTAMATHVLATTGQLERPDITSYTATVVAPAIVPPIAERKDMWWVVAELGRRMHFDLLNGRQADEVNRDMLLREYAQNGRDGPDALFEAGGEGIVPPRLVGWIRDKVLPEGRWRLTPPGMIDRVATLLGDITPADPDRIVLVSNRQLGRINAVGYVAPLKSRDFPDLEMHAQDADRLGIGDGEAVFVATRHGKLSARVKLRETAKAGVVALPHGWADTNVCTLTSEIEGIDPGTTQPRMTALPVEITRMTDAVAADPLAT